MIITFFSYSTFYLSFYAVLLSFFRIFVIIILIIIVIIVVIVEDIIIITVIMMPLLSSMHYQHHYCKSICCLCPAWITSKKEGTWQVCCLKEEPCRRSVRCLGCPSPAAVGGGGEGRLVTVGPRRRCEGRGRASSDCGPRRVF